MLLVRTVATALLLSLAGSALAEAELNGTYDAVGATADGTAYRGEVELTTRGKAVEVGWTLNDGQRYRGVALRLDDILGSAYWPEDEPFEDAGIVIYRIDGGRLDGVWMPQGGSRDLLGREELLGPASLKGRFEIVLGQNPGGSRYSGHVEIDRRGETYHFHWYSPGDSFRGNGVRIGNIMVVGYALGRAPGTVAYCVRGPELDGLWTYGQSARLGREALRPRSETDTAPQASTGTECLPTVAMNARTGLLD